MNLFKKKMFIEQINNDYAARTSEELLSMILEKFSKITLACSFGADDIVLLDMIMKINPNTDIFYLDTHLHFNETYETIEQLEKHYQKKFIKVQPKLTLIEQVAQYGEELWSKNANVCCNLRKVDPLTDILKNYNAWITGIRRDQTITRVNAQMAEYDVKFGLIKFNPIVSWTSEEVWNYIKKHKLIYNPLHDHNYPSIGCFPCTKQVAEGDDPRSGRWADQDKTECGLHK